MELWFAFCVCVDGFWRGGSGGSDGVEVVFFADVGRAGSEGEGWRVGRGSDLCLLEWA